MLNVNELLEIEQLSHLLDQFYNATGLANSILDMEGNILHGIGWKRICTDFHRANKISCAKCIENDISLANHLKNKEKYAISICQNGMVDAATPIVVDGEQVASLYIGQFFFEKPDKDFFIKQAEELGFDKEDYINALEECQVYDKEKILIFLDFFSEFTNMIGELALKIKIQKGLTEKINKVEKYNRSLIETSIDPIITIGPSGVITDVNSATEQATGLSRDKLICTDFSDYFTEPDRAKAGYQEVFSEGKVIDYELELKHIDGNTIPILCNASVYRDENGEIIGVFAAARDITQSRKTENELKSLKENLELLVDKRTQDLHKVQLLLKSSLESPKDMIILSIDMDYNYYYFNEAHKAAMKYSYDKDITLGMNLLENITSEEDKINAKINYDLALQGKSHSTIQEYGDIALNYYETYYNPVKNQDGEIIGATAFSRNITDRILREQALKQSKDKLLKNEILLNNLNETLENHVMDRTAQLETVNKELEAFSYSVSHDLKAPLRHITGYVGLLLKKYKECLPEEGLKYLDNISFSANNMGELIQGLLKFSRNGKQEMNQISLDMKEIVLATIKPIKEQETVRNIKWVLKTLPHAYGDLEMMKSVWANLIENAVKFTKKKATAKITIGAEETKNTVIYYVKDNGAGFDMTYSSKLFEIFQSLHDREDYEGTGIGLAIVRRIISRHGGKTWAEGEIDKGATFYFSLNKRKDSEKYETENDSLR